MRDGLALVVTGIVIGLSAAFLLAGLLKSLLFGIGAHDAVIFIAAPSVLVLTAALALFIPAHRAALVDPITTLNRE